MSNSQTVPPDYDELAQAMRDAHVDVSPAEAHGMITGALSVPHARMPGALFFGDRAVTATPEVEAFLRLVAALQEDVQSRLRADEFEFQPLLPDVAGLPDRVDAVAAWARGYVLGLAAAGVSDPKRLEGEVGEFLLDATRIGEAEMDEDGTPDEQVERELAEIVEYLRAGVQLVYDELRE